MTDTTENIITTVKVVDLGSKTLDKISSSVTKLGNRVKTTNTLTTKYNKMGMVLSKQLVTTEKRTDKERKTSDKLNKTWKLTGLRLFGMAFFLRRVGQGLMSLLQPAAQAFGIFDIWNALLLTTFAPIMEAILPLFLQFANYMMGLPDSVKLVIGGITILGTVLTGIGLLLASVGIAVQTLGGVFGLLVPAADGAAAALDTTAVAAEGAEAAAMGAATGSGFLTLIGWAGTGIGILIGLNGVADFINGTGKATDAMKNALIGIGAGLGLAIGGPVGGAVGAAAGWAIGISLQAVLPQGWQDNINTFFGYIHQRQVDTMASLQSMLQNGDRSMLPPGQSTTTSYNLPAPPGASTIPALKNPLPGYGSGLDLAGKVNDFIWRPGEGAVGISPDDTLVGRKSGAGGSSSNASINVTYNINVPDKSFIQGILDQNNKRLYDDIKRMVS